MDRKKSRTYQAMASALRERLGDREYCIGIDPGVGSIGIAVVAMEPDGSGEYRGTDIIYANSRIFLSSEGASDRALDRIHRNSVRHKRNRLKCLWKLLSEKGLMLPFSEEEHSDTSVLRFSDTVRNNDPYELRMKGQTEGLTLEELGLIIYHIAAHRGTSTVRTFLDEEKTVSEMQADSSRNRTREICASTGADTFIEVLFIHNRETGSGYRNSIGRSPDIVMPGPTRDIIENEMRKLLEVQRKERPDVLTDEYIRRIWDTVFFENPCIAPEPARCPYFPEEPRLPKASILNEERRLRENVNNIRIRGTINDGGRFWEISEPLSADEKELLYQVMRKGEPLTGPVVKRLLPHYRGSEIVMQGIDSKSRRIEGFRFVKLEEKSCFKALSAREKDTFIRLFISIRDDRILKERLREELGISEKDAVDAMSDIVLIGDYAPVGRTAMEIILDKIVREEITWSEAENRAVAEGLLPDISVKKVYDRLPYYGEVLRSCTGTLDGKDGHSEFAERAEKGTFNRPDRNRDEERYGKLRNPVIHQTLNELRKLLNEIMDIFGKKPIRITSELARGLRMSISEREREGLENARRDKEKKRIYDTYCVPHGLSWKYVRVFRLLEAQDWTCPYCLERMNVSDVLSGNASIDHILPYGETADNSENNLVVCDRHCNEVIKRKRIPCTAFASDPSLWSRIERFLDSNPAMKERKWRFMMDEEEYRRYLSENGFLSRFRGDNAYASKLISEYLRCLFPKERKAEAVESIKGDETAMLRRAWNLNGMTRSLAGLHDHEGRTLSDEGKDRTDARHHALDAIVAAYYTRSYKLQLNSLSSAGLPRNAIIDRIPLPASMRSLAGLSDDEARISFRRTVENFLWNGTYVSRKTDTGKNGELLKDTQYQVLERGEDDVMLYGRKPVREMNAYTFLGRNARAVESITKETIPEWLSEKGKELMRKRIVMNRDVFERIMKCRVQAEAEFAAVSEERKAQGLPPQKVSEKAVVRRALQLAGGKYTVFVPRKKDKVCIKGNGANMSAFDTGDNYSLDLWRDDEGRIQGEIIRKVNINRKGWLPEYRKNGYSLVARLFIKDVLEVDLLSVADAKTFGDRTRTIKANNAPIGRTFISICTFTESGNGIQVYFTSLNSEELLRNGSFRVMGISGLNARKVVLSPAGLVEYRSEIIRNAVTYEGDVVI